MQAWLADKLEHWPIERLLPYIRNARTHSESQIAQIAASIAEFGFTAPILAGSDGVIVAGHGRLAAARKLGLASVPVVVLEHLTPTQRRALVIADNRIAENAGWDDAMLRIELEDLQLDGFDLDITGFTDEEIKALMPVDVTEGLTDPDEAPPVPENPVTVPGDVWVMGKHRLLCGDSTRVDDLAKLCEGQMVDMWLTDPPYNVAYGGEKGNAANKNKVDGGNRNTRTILNDDMGDEQFRIFLRDVYTAADTVMKAGAVFYIWHSDTEGYNFRGAARDTNWTVRQCLIWKKSSIVLGRQDYQWMHEPCLYGWKEGAGHLWASDRKQTTILEFDKPARNDVHPTMKPVALFEYQMLNNTKGGDIVLDSFGGSGTTLIAAEKNGRIARLMELDPKYCDVIVKRWQDFTGQTATLEADGRTFDEVKNGNEKAQN